MTTLAPFLVLAQVDPSRPIAAQGEGTFWFPPEASAFAGSSDAAWYFIYWVSVFFTVLIMGVLAFFILKYRKAKHPKAMKTATHNTPLELVWSILPAILLGYMFWAGFRGYMDIRTPPRDSVQISVTGQKWNWSFTYPNGLESETLYVPVDRAVTLTMRSVDVIHSFFIPAFRTKMDVVPGRYATTWFVVEEPGEFTALCTEYCGTKHSDMLAPVVALPYDEWLATLDRLNVPPDDPVEWGRLLYHRKGCGQCHTLDGTAGVGPSWQGIWGRTEHLADGATITVDETYVHESIMQPGAKVVAGFTPSMPIYAGRVNDAEIDAIIQFMKTL